MKFMIITALVVVAAAPFVVLKSLRDRAGEYFANAAATITLDPTAIGLHVAATAADVVAHFERTRTALLDAQELVKKVTAAGHIPHGIDAQDLARKIQAGLTRAQALEVTLSQAAHDKTKPHDKPSTAADSAAEKGLEEAGFKDMKVEELRDECAKRNLSAPADATKKDLLQLLKSGSSPA